MKKSLLTVTLLALFSQSAFATEVDTKTEENIGVGSGLVAGAAIGGPVGAIIGAGLGGFFGNQVGKANALEESQQALSARQDENQQLRSQVALLKSDMSLQQVKKQQTEREQQARLLSESLSLDVMFKTGSADLLGDDEFRVARLSRFLKQFPQLHIHLEGFADERGTVKDNEKLSQARLAAVAEALLKAGVDAKRISTRNFGEHKARASSGDTDGYALDRRVTVKFVTAEEAQQLAVR